MVDPAVRLSDQPSAVHPKENARRLLRMRHEIRARDIWKVDTVEEKGTEVNREALGNGVSLHV
jgi:hypothetical protein